MIIAHRGFAGAAPENTLAAVRRAVELGVDTVELDVQRTADGELVIIHDVTLKRTTNAVAVFPGRKRWRVGDFTLAELRTLDAGSWFGPRFAGEKIPTLREVITALGPKTGLMLEVKSPELYAGVEADLVRELISRPGYLPDAVDSGRLAVASFHHEAMRRFHQLAPEIPIGLVFGTRVAESDLVAASTWVRQINPHFRGVTRALVERVHELGMTINPYTANAKRHMRALRDAGVDGIITNYPDVLRKVLAPRSQPA